MTTEALLFKEIQLLPELFLGIVLIYLTIHGTFLSISKTYPLIQTSIIYLGVLILFMIWFLLLNDNLDVMEISIFNNTIVADYLSLSSKIVITVSSIFCFLIIQQYLTDQKINQFEYSLLLLFAILGIFLLCSANDLITAYLAIELQSLAFYVLATFKKNSTFSIEAGLKYFILGAFSSALFLFGSSIIYGVSGTTNFEDFKDLFFWVFPGSIVALSEINEYYLKQEKTVLLSSLIQKINVFNSVSLSENEFGAFYLEALNLEDNVTNPDKTLLYLKLSKGLNHILSNPYAFEANSGSDVLAATHIQRQAILEDFSNFTNNLTIKDTQFIDKLTHEIVPLNDIISRWAFADIAKKLYSFSVISDYQELSYFHKLFDTNLLQFAIMFILISLFFKLALAPFHLWSPDVYEGSPSSSTFFFSVIPKLGVFVLLIRLFYYSFYGFIDNWRYYIVIIAILTIIIGSFVGLEQRKLKSLLAYSSIGHMGYSLIAFSSGTFEGMQMLFCYLILYMFSGLFIWSIFLLTRLKNKHPKKHNKDLTDIVLLKKSNKILAFFFATVLFSIAGFPPMIGFLVKIGVFMASVEASMYFVALVSILCSVIGTFYYIRLIKIMYFEKVLVGKLYYPINTQKSIMAVFFFFFLIFLFVNPTLLYLFSYKVSALTTITSNIDLIAVNI